MYFWFSQNRKHWKRCKKSKCLMKFWSWLTKELRGLCNLNHETECVYHLLLLTNGTLDKQSLTHLVDTARDMKWCLLWQLHLHGYEFVCDLLTLNICCSLLELCDLLPDLHRYSLLFLVEGLKLWDFWTAIPDLWYMLSDEQWPVLKLMKVLEYINTLIASKLCN